MPPTRTAHVPNASLSLAEAVVALLRPLDARRVEEALASRYGVQDVVLFASARGALSACVQALAPGERVSIPAFTCAAVANAVVSAGSQLAFVDVDSRGLVPADAWPAGTLPIVQDTYGFTAEGPSGRTFIRDSAHRAFPLELGGAAVAVTSFEHSKSLSAGRGGLAATDDAELGADLRRLRGPVAPGHHRAVQSLVTLTTVAMGRLDARGRHRAAELFRKVAWHLDESRLLGQTAAELSGGGVEPALLGAADGSAARLIGSQIRRAAKVADHRRRTVALYDSRAGVPRASEPLIRYPLAAEDPDAFERALGQAGWDVRGRWFNAPLHPSRTDLAAFGYQPGDAPNAERLAATVVNLPTHPLIAPADAEALIAAALAAGGRPLA